MKRRDGKRSYLAQRLTLRAYLRGSDFSEKLLRATTDEKKLTALDETSPSSHESCYAQVVSSECL